MNRLSDETSPYLLQHAQNPVDWYPWGTEAIEKARAEGKPIFLSIGYSACHWCHVMEHESFENEKIAGLMNEHFVNIKVDREERPDLDEIYMKAVMQLTGSGGWPMSVFLTPELEPFFGGTYFPPHRMHGRPGFPDVILSLSGAWRADKDAVTTQATRLAESIAKEAKQDWRAPVEASVLDRSLDSLRENFDSTWGGFGMAPKFPHAMDLRLMLRHYDRIKASDALLIATLSLNRMADGGVYDQLGGGFHRYSTDEKWLIPHFEKMLYDNALLIPVYLEAHLLTGEERFARIARESCEWILREMITAEGAFASTQDADSEGEEGKFFAWTPRELQDVLGKKVGRQAAEFYGVTPEGNFEHGTSALWRPDSASEVARVMKIDEATLLASMEEARKKLFAAREERVHPGWDDKVLTAWNGLAISAMAQSYQVLEDERFLAAAQRAARFISTVMRRDDGRLYATSRAGRPQHEACLDDYVFFIQGLIDLYESDFDQAWLRLAKELSELVEQNFRDETNDGYFTTGNQHEQLIARMKNPHDGALPSGNGVHAMNLLRLAELLGEAEQTRRADRVMRSQGKMLGRYPAAFSQMMLAVDWQAASPREVVIAGELNAADTKALLRSLRTTYAPARVVALNDSRADADWMPLLQDRAAGGTALAYVCRNYACQAPVADGEALIAALRD
ncbi:MAG: hypothetical protein ACI841_002384 [Planctomycetota bacterium]|jgi:uncharacterized protein YyaL (SSP411 family)